MSVEGFMYRRTSGPAHHHTSSSRGGRATSSEASAKQSFPSVETTATGGGTPNSTTQTTRSEAGTLHGQSQDALSTADGSDSSQPDAGGRGGERRWHTCLSFLSADWSASAQCGLSQCVTKAFRSLVHRAIARTGCSARSRAVESSLGKMGFPAALLGSNRRSGASIASELSRMYGSRTVRKYRTSTSAMLRLALAVSHSERGTGRAGWVVTRFTTSAWRVTASVESGCPQTHTSSAALRDTRSA